MSKLTAKPLTKGETKMLVSPLVVIQEKDTLFEEKYKVSIHMFDKEEYTSSLKNALNLLNDVRGKNIEIEYLTNILIGDVFRKRNIHEKELAYFKEGLKIIENNDHFNEGKLLFFNQNFKNGKTLAKNLLRIGGAYYKLRQIDSAAYYFKKTINISSLKDLSESKASAYSNLSAIYESEKEYGLARINARKAIDLYKKVNNKLLESGALNNLANIYLAEKNYEKANEIYNKAINIIENNNSLKAIKNKEDLYYNLAYVLYMQKDYKAYEYLDKSFVYKDTLTDREFRRIVKGVYAEYSERYKVERLKNEAILEEAEARKTNWFFGILSFLVIASSGVILYNYKLRQNNLKLKLSQTQFAQKSKLEKLKSESQVRILNATLDGKETERKQIAETLHDSVSSLLSSANLHLQATKMQFNGDTPIEINKTQKIIIEASQTIRDLSHTLVSSVLLKFGLKYAIIDMAEKYSNSQIQINTDIKNLRRYHQNFEIKVNNIIQEFVNNVLKHSKASKAIVRIEDTDGKLIINIQDNGIGFDKKVIPEKDGLGINQIDARIQMMKGEFNIDSNSDNGTKIAIVLPILEKEIPIRV